MSYVKLSELWAHGNLGEDPPFAPRVPHPIRTENSAGIWHSVGRVSTRVQLEFGHVYIVKLKLCAV
jgi:hypothetical protein